MNTWRLWKKGILGCTRITGNENSSKWKLKLHDAGFKSFNLRTSLRWVPNVLESRCKLYARCKKVISLQPCACNHTKANNIETKLWLLANHLRLGGQTVKHFRLLADKFEQDQSERKSTQAIAIHASHGQTESKNMANLPFGQGLKLMTILQ